MTKRKLSRQSLDMFSQSFESLEGFKSFQTHLIPFDFAVKALAQMADDRFGKGKHEFTRDAVWFGNWRGKINISEELLEGQLSKPIKVTGLRILRFIDKYPALMIAQKIDLRTRFGVRSSIAPTENPLHGISKPPHMLVENPLPTVVLPTPVPKEDSLHSLEKDTISTSNIIVDKGFRFRRLTIPKAAIKKEEAICSYDIEKELEILERIRTRLGNINHLEIALHLEFVGSLYLYFNNISEASQYLQHSVVMYRELNIGDHPDSARALNNLGVCYLRRGETEKRKTKEEEIEKGGTYLLEAMKINAKLYPIEKGCNINLAKSVNNVGKAWNDLKNPNKAIEYLELALEMYESLKDTLTMEDKIDLTKTLDSTGIAYYALGKLEEAAEVFEAGYIMRKELFGEDHPGTKVMKISFDQVNSMLLTEDSKVVASHEAMHIGHTKIGADRKLHGNGAAASDGQWATRVSATRRKSGDRIGVADTEISAPESSEPKLPTFVAREENRSIYRARLAFSK